MRAKHKFEFGLAIYFDNFRKCKFEFNFSGNYHNVHQIKSYNYFDYGDLCIFFYFSSPQIIKKIIFFC